MTRGKSTHFSSDGPLHDELELGRCDANGLPRWLATAAMRLSITWLPFLPTSNLRTKRLARIAQWLSGAL